MSFFNPKAARWCSVYLCFFQVIFDLPFFNKTTPLTTLSHSLWKCQERIYLWILRVGCFYVSVKILFYTTLFLLVWYLSILSICNVSKLLWAGVPFSWLKLIVIGHQLCLRCTHAKNYAPPKKKHFPLPAWSFFIPLSGDAPIYLTTCIVSPCFESFFLPTTKVGEKFTNAPNSLRCLKFLVSPLCPIARASWSSPIRFTFCKGI